MIVDSSALVAILGREPGYEALINLLIQTPRISISAGTLIEVRIIATTRGIGQDLEQLLQQLQVLVVPVDQYQADLALEGFRSYGKGQHPAGLNYGDLFAYALAKALNEPLLFVGNDFSRTDITPALS